MTVLLHTNNLLSDEVKGKIAERNCHPFCISKTFNHSRYSIDTNVSNFHHYYHHDYHQISHDQYIATGSMLIMMIESINILNLMLLLQKRFSVSMQYSIFYDIFQLERSILVLSYIPVHTYLESFNKGICASAWV